MIDRVDPTLLLPEVPAAEAQGPQAEQMFEKELARWVVKELTQTLFKEGSPLEGASHLQSLFQDALADRLVEHKPGSILRGPGTSHTGEPVALPRRHHGHDHDHADYRISSGFGYRNDPLGKGRRMHAGVDLAAPRGTPVHVPRDGVVRFAGVQGGYGNLVIVDHGDGLETRYAHLDSIAVASGDVVRNGKTLGAIGSTGRSTGNHLHFETRREGRALDPHDALPGFAAQVLGEPRR